MTQPKTSLKTIVSQHLELLDSTPLGVSYANLEGDVLGFTPYISNLLGYSKKELNHKLLSDPNFRISHILTDLQLMQLVKTEKDFISIEKSCIHKSGKQIWLNLNYTLLKYKNKRAIGIQCVSEDISYQKNVKSQLDRTEDLLTHAIQSTTTTVTLLELDGRVAYVNNLEPGIKRSDYMGSIVFKWLPKNLSAQIKLYILEIQENLESRYFESESTDPIGQIHYYHHNMSPVLIAGNGLSHISLISYDITDKRQLENKYNFQKDIITLGLGSIQMGTWQRNLKNKTITWDEISDSLYGCSSDTFSSFEEAMKALVYVENQSGQMHPIKKEPNTKVGLEGEYQIKRYDDGAIRWISFKSNTYTDATGAISKISGVIWDTTDKKEKELSDQRIIQLEYQNQELKRFAHMASHDLKSPLRTISNYSQLLSLQYKGELDDRANSYLEFISTASKRMNLQIQQLLSYSQLNTTEPKDEIDCNAILENLQQSLSHDIEKAQASITYEELPPIEGNLLEITLLFQNLISNALKYKRAKVPAAIHINCIEYNDFWQFGVRDNGIGIKAEFHENIFKLFHRLHTREEYEGTGIGLAKCEKTVNFHGGQIWVTSNDDVGCTFHFTISKNQK